MNGCGNKNPNIKCTDPYCEDCSKYDWYPEKKSMVLKYTADKESVNYFYDEYCLFTRQEA